LKLRIKHDVCIYLINLHGHKKIVLAKKDALVHREEMEKEKHKGA